LIIHESRFTYRQAGLAQVVDLGEWWERETGHPIPLGAILARRDLAPELTAAAGDAIRTSLDFARAHEAAVAPYVREHAFEMDEDVMRAHIALYVNDYSRDLGTDGIAAIDALFELGAGAGLIPAGVRPEYV
jgi:1,4-dihydroxy-6-naphthoate synthase